MKKKLMAVLLGTVMVLSLAACGNSKANFADDELVFKGSENVEVALNHYIYVGVDEIGEYTEYDTLSANAYELYEEALATSRGLKIGMSLSDYKDLYAVKNGYATWELISYEEEGPMTGMKQYANQTAREMYNEADSIWLDLGWCKENGKWRVMTDAELIDVWFCEAKSSDFGEFVILSVFLDDSEEIGAMYLYHATYDKNWVSYQNWAD